MNIRLLTFGRITEKVSSGTYELPEGLRINELKKYLEMRFKGLQHMSYQIALDKKIADGMERLYEDCEVALLPPFSGG